MKHYKNERWEIFLVEDENVISEESELMKTIKKNNDSINENLGI